MAFGLLVLFRIRLKKEGFSFNLKSVYSNVKFSFWMLSKVDVSREIVSEKIIFDMYKKRLLKNLCTVYMSAFLKYVIHKFQTLLMYNL